MSAFLLDAHILLWSLDDVEKLTARQRRIVQFEPTVFVSMATMWEIAIKQSLGKLAVRSDLHKVVKHIGYGMLGIKLEHLAALRLLPHHHRDPFDRMIIAQARTENLTILTADGHFSAYDVALA